MSDIVVSVVFVFFCVRVAIDDVDFEVLSLDVGELDGDLDLQDVTNFLCDLSTGSNCLKLENGEKMTPTLPIDIPVPMVHGRCSL